MASAEPETQSATPAVQSLETEKQMYNEYGVERKQTHMNHMTQMYKAI